MIYTEKPADFVPGYEAVGCFVETGGRILQLLRAPNKKIEPAKWGAPAGCVNPGEDKAVAMAREFKEETGISVFPSAFKFVKSFCVDYCSVQFLYHVFWMEFAFEPNIRLSSEHSAYVWIPPYLCNSLDLMKDEWECIKLVYCI